jgi:hypothetical protein
LHIQDASLDVLQVRSAGHAGATLGTDNDVDGRAFDPSSIQVNAAVFVAYEIVRDGAQPGL